jgi:hypothetical protein
VLLAKFIQHLSRFPIQLGGQLLLSRLRLDHGRGGGAARVDRDGELHPDAAHVGALVEGGDGLRIVPADAGHQVQAGRVAGAVLVDLLARGFQRLPLHVQFGIGGQGDRAPFVEGARGSRRRAEVVGQRVQRLHRLADGDGERVARVGEVVGCLQHLRHRHVVARLGLRNFRARALAAIEQPAVGRALRLQRIALRLRLRQLVLGVLGERVQADHPHDQVLDAHHELRVAGRRLRDALAVARPALRMDQRLPQLHVGHQAVVAPVVGGAARRGGRVGHVRGVARRRVAGRDGGQQVRAAQWQRLLAGLVLVHRGAEGRVVAHRGVVGLEQGQRVGR